MAALKMEKGATAKDYRQPVEEKTREQIPGASIRNTALLTP